MRYTIFKQNKPRGFAFKPRYYDAEKEALDARVAQIEKQVALEKEGKTADASDLRSKIKSQWGHGQSRKKANKKSNLRVALIAGVLLLLFYLFIYTDFQLPF